MKNNYLTLLFLFFVCFGFTQTKDSLSVEEQARREKNIQAGNPFKKFGYKPKIATLSKGKYLEFHDLDSIVKIGSFSYHVKKKSITGYTRMETQNSEATLRPEVISRWLSPDPLAAEFPSWSPYNFVMNNPIRFVDPTGMAPEDWRNSDGNLVYDPTANDGKGAYTEHATQNDKNIGNALQSTATGKVQFNKLVNSTQPTEIVINSGKGPEGEAGKTINTGVALEMDMSTGKVEGAVVSKSTITVFMSTVGALADAESKNSVGTLNGTSIEGLSFDQIIGAVVGHEIEHTTSDNVVVQQTQNVTKKQIEATPTAISNKIIDESRASNKKQ